MGTREIRRRCSAIMRTLDVPSPFDVRIFCESLAIARSRPIDLRPIAMPPGGPSGMWLATSQRDYILYEEDTTPLHQEHIIMHEVGHLLADHGAASLTNASPASLALQHLDPRLIERVLHRATYSIEEERTAETIASMILEQANRWKPVSEWEAPAHGAAVRQRVRLTVESLPEKRSR